jgi:hypothetical protein
MDLSAVSESSGAVAAGGLADPEEVGIVTVAGSDRRYINAIAVPVSQRTLVLRCIFGSKKSEETSE